MMDILSSSVTVPGILLLVLLYLVGTFNHGYFIKQSVIFVKPWPFVGNMAKFLFRVQYFGHLLQDMYNLYPQARFVGVFDFMKPLYLIRDPELVKQICIKESDHFINRRGQFDEELDPIFSRNLFSMHDNKWKAMRSVLSPTFTGSKMRSMFGLVTNYCEKAVESIANSSREKVVQLEMKDLFTRFGNDLVATCAFGIEVNSLENRDNEFYRQGKIITNLSGIKGLIFIGFSAFPKLMKFLRISFLNKESVQFFRDLVSTAIDHREKNNIVRHDMINLLLQVKSNELKVADSDTQNDKTEFSAVDEYHQDNSGGKNIKWTHDDITGQCMVFFFGGFETTATLLSFMAYELAINQHVQEQLQREIDAVKEQLIDGELTYEQLQHMKYMDQVISESLRLRSPVAFLDRYCNKACVIEDKNQNKIHLKPGDAVWIPVVPILLDDKYFPNPTKFDPERFSSENKGTIDPTTFLPFGIGPRNCIGSRFALMECKAVFFFILSKFNIEVCKKTQLPVQMKKSALNPVAENGIWLNFRLRN